MAGPLLRDPGPLKDPGPLRPGLYDRAYAAMRSEADDVAGEEYNTMLLNTTRVPLPDPVMPESILTETTLPGIERKPVQGKPVFGTDEEFVRAQREASTLADTTPLGQFTPYRPGFKADTTLKTEPVRKKPEVLSDWEIAFPGYKAEPSLEPELLSPARARSDIAHASYSPIIKEEAKFDINKHYRDAIASIESRGSGDYKAVGPKDPKLGRALGRYQIMEKNIGPWSKAALGRELTPKQFLSSPEAQDAIFDHVFNSYVEQFGSPEKAARAWIAGPGGVDRARRRDVLGTSVGEYGRKFQEELDRLTGK